MAVARAGLHALVEKPLGVDAREVERIHRCYDEEGRIVCPTHQYAFQRSVFAAKAGLGRVGAIRRISFDVCSAGAASNQMDPDQLIAEILPHLLSIVQMLQPTVDVATLDWSLVRSADGEWMIAAATQEETLVTMSLSASGRPTRFLTLITGERGSIEIDHFHDFAVMLPGPVSKTQKILAPFTRSSREFLAASVNLASRMARQEYAYPGLATIVGKFYEAVRNPSAAVPVTPHQSIANAVARDKIVGLVHRG